MIHIPFVDTPTASNMSWDPVTQFTYQFWTAVDNKSTAIGSNLAMAEGDDDEHSDSGEVGEIEVMYEEPRDDDVVLQVLRHEDDAVIEVTYRSMKHLEMAMDASSNQPTYFFKCKYVIDSVCSIVDANLVDYLFTNDEGPAAVEEPGGEEKKDEEAIDFDWNLVEPGRKETYPPSRQPTEEEFGTVRVIYNEIKKNKDERARANGMPNSGIQHYKTFKAKWAHFRSWSAVYDKIMKGSSKQTKLDKMTADLKLCRSEKHIDETISTEIMRYINKLKREARKRREQEEIQARLQELEQQKQKTKKDLELVNRKEKEVQGRRNRAVTRSGAAPSKKDLAAVRRQEKEVKSSRKDVLKAQKCVEREIKQLSKRKSIVDNAKSSPDKKAKRVALRNDLSLVNEIISPRKKAELDGDEWKPPMRGGDGSFQQPGEDWKTDAVEKVHLIIALHKHLMGTGELERSPSFLTVMEYLGVGTAGQDSYDFSDRVFIYILALDLYQNL